MSSTQAIYLPNLPMPDVIEHLDYEEILAAIKQQFNALKPNLIDQSGRAVVLPAQYIEAANGEKYWKVPVDSVAGLFYLDLESDPATRLLEIAAYRELILRQRVNDAALAVMPAYTTGLDQDELYKIWGLERLLIEPADELNSISHPAIYESDTDFRRRYALALDQFTTAGSEHSYIYHGLSADGQVKDITTFAPNGAEVVITVLSQSGNGEPTVELLQTVYDYLSDKKKRPIADDLAVQPAEIIEYQINANLIFNYGPSPDEVLAQVNKNLENYIKNQHRLGFDIELTALAHV
jgi:phage-related baseplate assembly protein